MGRKRRRTPAKSDSDDSQPIAKRMNRLHIERDVDVSAAAVTDQRTHSLNCGDDLNTEEPCAGSSRGGDRSHTQSASNNTTVRAGSSTDDSSTLEEKYEPELNATDNPHYFHINGQLHDAHTDRLKRARSVMNRSFPNS